MKTQILTAALLTLIGLNSGRAAVATMMPASGEPQSAAAVPTRLRMQGIITRFDSASRTLSLKTNDGTVQIQLPATVRVRQWSADIDVMTLAKLQGYRAAIRYSESAGGRTAESIHIFGKDEGVRR